MKKVLWPFLLVVCLGVVAYANTFRVPFQFDDLSSIVENPVIQELDNFVWNSTGYAYNPRRFVGYLTFALNYHFGGLDVTGYHVVNLLVHIINAVLVYFLVVITFRTPYFVNAGHRREAIGEGQRQTKESKGSAAYSRAPTTYSRFVPLFAALLFVAHPLQTQAVTYIVQRFTSLATMFYLLSLVLYIRGRLSSRRAGKLASYFLSLSCAVCAMKTKEIAFTLPIVIVLYEFCFFDAPLRKKLLILLPVLATLLIIPAGIMGTHMPLGDILSDLSDKTRVQTDISRLDYLLTEIRVVTTYIRLIFFPINQNLDYDYPIYRSLFTPSVFPSFLFLLALFGTAVWLVYRSRQPFKPASGQAGRHEGKGQRAERIEERTSENTPLSSFYSMPCALCALRLIAFGILWFFITLSVESSVIPIADVIFEHRLYLPSVGAFITLSAVFLLVEFAIKNRRSSPRPIVYALCALLILILSTATYARNRIWQDQVVLWRDVVRKSPGGARAYNNLGFLSLGRGHPDEAIGYFRTALKLNPLYAAARTNLGVAYYRRGWISAAIGQFQTAVGLSSSASDLAEAHHNLGLAYAKSGMPAEALEEFETALKSAPDSPKIYSDMGVVFKERGSSRRTVRSFRKALALDPDYAPAYFNLGMLYKERGVEAGAAYLRRAHKLDPSRF